jgi:hypothetical protein
MSKNEILKLIADRGIEVVKISKEEFEDLKDLLYENGIDRVNIAESSAMFLYHNDAEYIVIDKEDYNKQTDDIKAILLAHELSHSEGFIDEEKTDFNAMKYLDENQKNIMIKSWRGSHKRTYVDFLRQGSFKKDF